MRAILVVMGMVLTLAGWAGAASAFSLQLTSVTNGLTSINPTFGNVQNFSFNIDFVGPAIAGATYDNASVQQVEYGVSGGLSTNPPTPSGFSSFALNRTPTGEGVITPTEWIFQGSSIGFQIDAGADLFDGVQLDELVADETGLILEINAREFERLDRARYHPPLLRVYEDGTALFQNSNNSSGSTSTANPGTMELVDVDFGEEFITGLVFDTGGTTIVTPEPGTGVLFAAGLVLLARGRRRG